MWTVPVHEELRLAELFLKRHEPSFGAQLHQSSEWNGYAEFGSIEFGAGVSLSKQARHLKKKNYIKFPLESKNPQGHLTRVVPVNLGSTVPVLLKKIESGSYIRDQYL